jgi:hypothetical protein
MKIIMSVVTLTVLIVLCSAPGMAQGANTPLPQKDVLTQTVTTAIAGLVFGSIGAYIAALIKLKELDKAFEFKISELDKVFKNRVKEMETQMALQQAAQKQSEKANLRLRYVNPLLNVTEELVGKIASIEGRIGSPYENEMKDWFRRIKSFCDDRNKDDREEKQFAYWFQYEGLFAMTTLHKAAVYFSYADHILQASPFSELEITYAEDLKKHLKKVREAFGGENGIYPDSQDAVGTCAVKDDRVANYTEFCRDIVNASDNVGTAAFLRTIDFFHRDDLLTKAKMSQVRTALDQLQQFLSHRLPAEAEA